MGSQWFNFDDRRVKAVRESDIERFYGGKESAYMLFYRRKSLTRPPEAQGNKEHLIPEHILQRINEANHKIREERYVCVPTLLLLKKACKNVIIKVHLQLH